MSNIDDDAKRRFVDCVRFATAVVANDPGATGETVRAKTVGSPQFESLREHILQASDLAKSLLTRSSNELNDHETRRLVDDDIWCYIEWLLRGRNVGLRDPARSKFNVLENDFESRWSALEWYNSITLAPWSFVAPLVNLRVGSPTPIYLAPWLMLRRFDDGEAKVDEQPTFQRSRPVSCIEALTSQPKQFIYLPPTAERPVVTAVVALRLLKTHRIWPVEIKSQKLVPFGNEGMSWRPFNWLDYRGVGSGGFLDEAAVVQQADETRLSALWNRVWQHSDVSEMDIAIRAFVASSDAAASDMSAALLKAWIALEALLLRPNERQKREKAARRLASMIAVDANAHQQTYDLARASYKVRSELVHGRQSSDLLSVFWRTYELLRTLLIATLMRGSDFLPAQLNI